MERQEKSFNNAVSSEESAASPDISEQDIRRKIENFLQNFEFIEGSVFKLSKDPRFYTDPNGIDPIELLSEDFKSKTLGEFRKHWIPEMGPEKKKLQVERLAVELPDVAKKTTLDFVRYKKCDVVVRHFYRNGARYLESFINTQGSANIPKIRWTIGVEAGAKGEQLLGFDVETATRESEPGPEQYTDETGRKTLIFDIKRDTGKLPQDLSDEQLVFFFDPIKYADQIYNKNETSRANYTEAKFLKMWQWAFDDLRDPNNKFKFYPRQMSDKIPGLAVGILSRAIEEAKTHEYSGVAIRPAFFHDAEFLEKQGFKFERPEDAERMAMIKTALRIIDQDRYDAALREGFKAELEHNEAVKRAKSSRLTPQERSWIVVLNSLRNQKKILKEFDLLEKLKKESEWLEQLVDSTLYQLRRLDSDPHKAYYSDEIYYDEERLARLTEKQDKLRKWLKLFSSAGFHLPSEESHKQFWNENRMLLRFKGGVETPEQAQEELDNLIANEIVTGNTLYPARGELGKIMESEQKSGPPFYIVYHMYDKNGLVKQSDGKFAARDNVGHFEEVKKEIGVLGLEVRAEKAWGNVRNPGPNQPYGWESEEPSVRTDELSGIERSSQNVLVISCDSVEEVKRAAGVLHKISYKETENETGNDPRWFVPDIRIFGLSENDAKKLPHYKSALLHTKKGQKDGYASTITHETHRMVSGFKHVPVFIHEAMDGFIAEEEKRVGEYEFVSR